MGPTGSHQWVTFLDPGTTSEEEQVGGQASDDPDLGPPLELGPDLEDFLQELVTMQREDRGSDPSQEASAEDYEWWVEWRGQRVNTPNWWQEVGGDSRAK